MIFITPFLFFLLSSLLTVPAQQLTPSSSSLPSKSSTNFIQSRCSNTTYPDLCYTSLGRFTKQVHHDKRKLAVVATKVTMARFKRLSAYVTALKRNSTQTKRPGLDQCIEQLYDAVDSCKYTLQELKHILKSNNGVRDHAYHANMNMNDARASGQKCISDLGVEKDGIKGDVSSRATKVYEYVDNALDLIDAIAFNW